MPLAKTFDPDVVVVGVGAGSRVMLMFSLVVPAVLLVALTPVSELLALADPRV